MLRLGLLNAALRALTLASKFVLLLAMARYFPPADVGTYGLASGAITMAIYVLGLDFYVFNTREVLARSADERTPLIRDQLVFHALTYVVAIPAVMGIVFGGAFLPWRLAGWFLGVLIVEHLSQEAFRLLVVLGRPVAANVALFLRAGAWIFPLALLLLVNESSRHVRSALIGWFVGALASIALAAWQLRGLPWGAARGAPVGWRWIRTAAMGALPFFLGTLALRGTEYCDRFFLQRFAGESLLGVYTFYWNVASAVQTLVIAGVVQLLYPAAVEAYQNGDLPSYRAEMERMTRGAFGMAVLASVGAMIMIGPVLQLIGRPLYAEHRGVLWLLVTGVLANIAAMIPNYALYARRRDRLLLAANASALVASLGANAVLAPRFGIYGSAGAYLLANLTLAVAMIGVLLGVRRREFALA